MKVHSASERAKTSRKLVFELLVADQPERETSHDPNSSFWNWADRVEVADSRFPETGASRTRSTTSATRPWPCSSTPASTAISASAPAAKFRSTTSSAWPAAAISRQIVFDFNDPMGNSTCVACGECVQACPTGALMPATLVDAEGTYTNAPDREVNSVCPYCGVGCQLTYQIHDDKIVAVEGRDGPSNQNRLCVKGRFGFDYAHHPDRLTVPLIRKEGVSKHDVDIDPLNPFTHFREATWEEALAVASGGLRRSATSAAATRWPASARPRVRTKRPISSRSSSAPASAPTMSTTARVFATHRRCRR